MCQPRLKLANLKGFPECFEQEKILTSAFLEASDEIIGVIESFGKLFKPVVTDMRGNSSQLYQFYSNNTHERKYVEDLILSDQEKMSAVWLIWLKRALEFIDRFFFHILHDDDIISQKSDNLHPMLAKAYAEVLKPYHGFIIQGTFSMLSRFVPSRLTLFGNDELFKENMEAINFLLPNMRKNILKIDNFLKENNLNNTGKV